MRKSLGKIAGVLCIVCILASCCVTDQNGDPCAVNYILFAIAIVFGICSKKFEK